MKKAKACFADGGVVGSDGMTDAQREKKNAALRSLGMSNSTAPEPAPQPVAQPVQQQQPQSRGLIGDAMNLIGNRGKQIDKAAGYANGGLIRGIGSPTSDSIDGRVEETGEPIKVSTGERIVSAAQDKLLQRLAKAMGYQSVDAFFEAGTGKPVGPTIKGGKRAAADGSAPGGMSDEERNKIIQSGNIAGQWLGGSSTPTVGGNESTAKEYGNAMANSPSLPQMAFPNTMAAIQAGGDAAKSAADAGNYGAAIGQVGRGAISGIAGLGSDVMNSAAYALDPAANALKTLVTGDNSPARQPAQAPSTAQKTQSALQQATYSNEGRSVSSPITKSNPGAIVDNEFSKDGRTYNVNPTSQTGISRVTAPGTSPLYTNINPEQAITGLKNQSIGQPADQEAQGLSRIANANKIRGEMIANRDKAEGVPAGGWAPSILGDGGIEADNAEKTARWRNDDILAHANRGNQAAIGALLNSEAQRNNAALGNETQRMNAGLAAQVAGNRDNVTMRGQDLQAQSEAARIAGNPVDNQTKQLSLVQAQKMQQLYDKAAGGDAGAIKELQLRNPKEPNYSNRYTALPNIKRYNDMGQVIGEEPGGMFDNMTGTAVGNQQQTGSQQATAPKAGEVRGGYRFKGGNPADKASWEKA